MLSTIFIAVRTYSGGRQIPQLDFDLFSARRRAACKRIKEVMMIINVKFLSLLSTTPQWLFFNRQPTDDAKYEIASFAQIENHLKRTLSPIFPSIGIAIFIRFVRWIIRTGRIQDGRGHTKHILSLRYLLLVSMKKSEVTDRDSGIHPSPAVLIECRFIICYYYRCDRYSEHSFAKLIYLQVVLNKVLRVCLPCRPFKLLIRLH